MKTLDRRKDKRIGRQFPAMLLCRTDSSLSIEGESENLSQHGAFIRTKNWHALHAQDRAIVTFFLPPEFTGQDRTIGLQGEAVITRIDQENEGVGLQFLKGFKHFEQVKAPEVAGQLKHKQLAYYLSTCVDVPLAEFVSNHPNGFLVERSRHFFDRNVIVQFITDIADDKYVLEQIQNGSVHIEALKSRVLEIKKKHSRNQGDNITIGRAPNNDIVLYNKLVSKSHACLHFSPSRDISYLLDIGSTNGTFVNDDRIASHKKYQIADGDEISFGPETKVIYFSAKAFHAFLAELKST